jgi:two-component system sensor histidine kinase BaeS
MMRSLAARLSIAFLIVGLLGVGLIALFASRATQNEFRNFIFNEYSGSFIDQLVEHYRTHDGWNGIQAALPLPERFPFQGQGQGQGQGMGPRPGNFITMTDGSGIVIVPGFGYYTGEQVPQEIFQEGVPIAVDGQIVGYVLQAREAFREDPSETAFLNRVTRLLIYGAAGALIFSLLLGILLSRALTRPIRELTTATQAVAGGDLGHTVPVRSKDELGQLATAFNRMSSELARAQDLRRQMTADIAHELRTPLSVILGHVDALAEGVLPANAETFDVIRDETTQLGRLVEDLRTLSRADAGELTLNLQPVQPYTLLERASAAQRPFAVEKQIEITLEPQSDIPQIMADTERMAQVLGNLLSNALRYTPEGGTITLQSAAVEDGVEMRVIDSGPGIESDELPHVFNRFYRGDKSRQRETGGSGLGLAIAKSIVELHGGRIWVESEPGQGAAFVIWLPTAKS